MLEIRDIRQRAALPPFLRRLAAQTGQVLNIASASRAAGLAPSLGEDYTTLLEAVFLLHRVPSWGSTLSARVNRHPKVHVVDTGLGGRLLGIASTTASSGPGRQPVGDASRQPITESEIVTERSRREICIC